MTPGNSEEIYPIKDKINYNPQRSTNNLKSKILSNIIGTMFFTPLEYSFICRGLTKGQNG